MNQASTRSHCIFTIHISSKEPGSDTIRRSKLHLVDLAGSERVAKSGVGGKLLTEAKYINLSLHYLEQVIIALAEKNRSHIPYRNSMMTSVLRDSLGGNCMTTMIATLSLDKRNIDESISTCRFAQRVALIKNEATLNEEIDPQLMIVRLKKEIQALKDELSLITGEQRTEELTHDEILSYLKPNAGCASSDNRAPGHPCLLTHNPEAGRVSSSSRKSLQVYLRSLCICQRRESLAAQVSASGVVGSRHSHGVQFQRPGFTGTEEDTQPCGHQVDGQHVH
ncbi:kinesin KIF6 [Pelobates cultripes]|uniref:Kinesin-like protein n=1 Tax=Pelobates cultripes TaxID=61616 RepID=A0AAD1TH40_PELCU|nr:kinesin KIF6 [Pelobates cultripes]